MRKFVIVFYLLFFSWQPGRGAAEVVIAALGDSLTQGYGLKAQDGFVPQMQSWLEAQGVEVRLINAGVSGDTTAGGAARVAWTLTPEVQGMIVALGGNDVLRGIDPALSRTNLEAILGAAQAADVAVLLVGMQAPGNFGAEYKAAFEGIFPDLSAQYNTLLVPNFFAGLGDDPEQVIALMQADGIHPNAKGVRRIVDAFGPSVLELVEKAQK